jgi:glutamine amidotransferase
MVVIIDYQAGNIGSIKNMVRKLGHEARISSSPEEVEAADQIILPGVGSFDYGVSKLNELGLRSSLEKKREANTPILGICLGAQLMCNSSEEGKLPGLRWINAKVIKFPTSSNGRNYKVPHMGWDTVQVKKDSKLFEGLEGAARFYFVHSYYIKCETDSDVLASNKYGVDYHSAFERGNVIGVQYHPEKSHKFGKQLLKNFLEKL